MCAMLLPSLTCITKSNVFEFESLAIQEQAHLEQAVRDNVHLSAHIADAKVC